MFEALVEESAVRALRKTIQDEIDFSEYISDEKLWRLVENAVGLQAK